MTSRGGLRVTNVRSGDRTEALLALCQKTHWRPPPSAVRRLVMGCERDRRSGVDVLRKLSSSSRGSTILHQLVWNAQTDAVLSCLETGRKMNFTRCEDRVKQNVMMLTCQRWVADPECVALMEAFVSRLERCPHDEVVWEHVDHYKEDVLAVAARHHKLSVVWPLLWRRAVPYFVCRRPEVNRILLPVVWLEDWRQAEREMNRVLDRRYHHNRAVHWPDGALMDQFFDTTHTVWIPPPRKKSTRLLCQECWRLQPDPERVRQLVVDGGADVLFLDPLNGKPLLHTLVEKLAHPLSSAPTGFHATAVSPAAACVLACLQSPQPIDFSQTNWLLDNPFLTIWSHRSLRSQDSVAVLRGLMRRWEHGPPPRQSRAAKTAVGPRRGEDHVELHQMENDVNALLSAFARGPHFTLLWNALKRRRHLREALRPPQSARKPIPVTTEIKAKDLKQLSRRDKKLLVLQDPKGHKTFGKVQKISNLPKWRSKHSSPSVCFARKRTAKK